MPSVWFSFKCLGQTWLVQSTCLTTLGATTMGSILVKENSKLITFSCRFLSNFGKGILAIAVSSLFLSPSLSHRFMTDKLAHLVNKTHESGGREKLRSRPDTWSHTTGFFLDILKKTQGQKNSRIQKNSRKLSKNSRIFFQKLKFPPTPKLFSCGLNKPLFYRGFAATRLTQLLPDLLRQTQHFERSN